LDHYCHNGGHFHGGVNGHVWFLKVVPGRLSENTGLENPEGIFDQPSWAEIFELVDSEQANVFFVEESRTEGELSEKERIALNKIRKFLVGVSGSWQQKTKEVLEKYSKSRRGISEKVLKLFLEKKWDMPVFKIYPPNFCSKMLGNFQTPSKDFLVVFELPKPLSVFWFKDFSESKDVGKAVASTEWGWIYRSLISVVWGAVDYDAREAGLFFRRLNDNGYHKPGEFYYVFAVNEYEQ